MSAISETCNCGHDILDLLDILQNVSFITSKTEHD